MPKAHPTRRSRHAKASEGPPDDRTMSPHCRATRHAEELLASALAPVETARNQRHILDSDPHSLQAQQRQAKPLTLTIKGTTTLQDCRLQIVKAYLSVRGTTAGTLFLYCPSVLVTKSPSLMSSYEEPCSFVTSVSNSLNHTAFL